MPAPASSLPLPPWTLGPFVRPDNARPVIRPNAASRFDCPLRQASVAWEARHAFNPAAVVHEGRVAVLYRAEDDRGPGGIGGYTSRLGLAVSDDGLVFRTEPHPVFFPAEDAQKPFEWTGGCEDPRLATGPDGTYVLTYTQFPGRNPAGGNFPWRIGLATSRDLRTWTKHGGAFQGTPHENLRIKSAGILQTLENGRLVAARVRGKYWMYFGESFVSLASSDDLIRWTPLTDAHGAPLQIMRPRAGAFDSEFTEVGPPPLLTEHGIVLVYNGKNRPPSDGGDPSLAAGIYACGQALFARDDPAQFLARLDRPFFQPELEWETAGQYAAGTTFAEGLVFFEGRWHLYYGCADTFVGCARTE